MGISQSGFWVTAELLICQVESYVAHIRELLEERECLTADYERDNEDLRHELHQIKHQQGEFSETDANLSVCILIF